MSRLHSNAIGLFGRDRWIEEKWQQLFKEYYVARNTEHNMSQFIIHINEKKKKNSTHTCYGCMGIGFYCLSFSVVIQRLV